MRRVQAGFIGAGNFTGKHHLPTVRDSEIMEIAAIADIDQARLDEHSSSMKVGYTTTDYRKVLEDPAIDIVIIGTRQDLHPRLIVEGLESGKWVFCEKPMAETEEETKAVLAAENSAKGKLAVGFNRRFAPAYRDAKELMRDVPRPWYINYRLMFPAPGKRGAGNFYEAKPRILYEGCHILDLVCWFLGEKPARVFMTGDRLRNNCCILDFPDGSQLSFMCGSMGSFSFWKEYMELFGNYAAITVSEFSDMRVRGIRGQCDRIFPPMNNVLGEEAKKFGFDFYEMYKGAELCKYRKIWEDSYGMDVVPVRRPVSLPFDVSQYVPVEEGVDDLQPDKGWTESLEHFAGCFLEGRTPGNADGQAGALSTEVALALLESLDEGNPVNIR